jgi:hypothetical protein
LWLPSRSHIITIYVTGSYAISAIVQFPRQFYNAQLPREFCIFFLKIFELFGKKCRIP